MGTASHNVAGATPTAHMKRAPLPPKFIERRVLKQIWWVKEVWTHVFPEIINPFVVLKQPPSAPPSTGGRNVVHRVALEDGGHAIIRRYQRGGFVRHFFHELYWDRPFRPLAELTCTELARRRGIPTVEVLAAGIEKVGYGFYRGVIVSREVEGLINSWAWLQKQPLQSERQTMIKAIAQAIFHMHEAGLRHADLNLTNILVGMSALHPEVRIIELDRGRVFPGSLSYRERRQNLQRLQRSLDKLDPSGQFSSPADVDLFCRTYQMSLSTLSPKTG
jgi:3-deoxy-D-manno-octulosonic acid kinase